MKAASARLPAVAFHMSLLVLRSLPTIDLCTLVGSRQYCRDEATFTSISGLELGYESVRLSVEASNPSLVDPEPSVPSTSNRTRDSCDI